MTEERSPNISESILTYLDNVNITTAYGEDDCTPDMPGEEILLQLFALNQQYTESGVAP